MGALSFKARFIPNLEAGLQRKKGGKRQSIRNFRKRPLKVGEPVYLYYAMRTKQCRKIGEAITKNVQVIRIDNHEIVIYDILNNSDLKMNRWYVSKPELNRFARADGFNDFEDMKAFWIAEHGKNGTPFPYTGNLYKW